MASPVFLLSNVLIWWVWWLSLAFNNLIYESVDQVNGNVEKYTYSNVSTSTEFVHYKVIGGDHEWFENEWDGIDWGFNTSEELVSFFINYKLSDFINAPLGDLNSDSMINIQDVIIIVNIILNGEYQDLADMNSDNEIKVLDVLLLVNIILSP